MKQATITFSASLLLAAPFVHAETNKEKQPNIVFILADDLGYGDLSCYGQEKFMTPNIDRLAQSGMRFTQCYSGTTVSAPSRSCLLTGTHSGHTPVRGNMELEPEGQFPLPADARTIFEVMKEAGYKTSAPTHLREFRTCDDADIAIGTELKADVFAENDYLDVTGTIKGRGFQGVVKRYNFGGGRASHGGAWTRRTGSIGMCEFPGRVWLGKRMPGHMGNVRRTIQNLQIVRVMAEDNVILVKGAVPGANGGILLLRKAIKK